MLYTLYRNMRMPLIKTCDTVWRCLFNGMECESDEEKSVEGSNELRRWFVICMLKHYAKGCIQQYCNAKSKTMQHTIFSSKQNLEGWLYSAQYYKSKLYFKCLSTTIKPFGVFNHIIL